MSPYKINRLYQALSASITAPVTELVYASPFELLIAVILSAQATDTSVNQATRELFAKANTPEALVALGLVRVRAHIKRIGLFNTKAKNIINTSRLLIKEHDSQVPRTRAALESLPGVGRKTANVILNTAFGQPTIAVDTHVFRVSNRTGLAPGKTVGAVEASLMKATPKRYLTNAHHLLILHGRYTCTARRPNCPGCALKRYCQFSDKTDG
ncbi:MAG: endonuclease III [Arenicellales bacterium]|nr:endonuclease III [Arenicellales bacterium]